MSTPLPRDDFPGRLRENELLAFIARGNARLPSSVSIPPGDDMAMIRVGGADLLIAVDPLIEGVHFRTPPASPEQIARKALTRNLSDVAAMAAWPVAAVVAAQLPREASAEFAQRLVRGLQDTAAEMDCPIVGGDVAVHDGKLSLTVTVLAEPAGVEPVRRGTARVGDGVWVSGVLGGSLRADGTGHHLDFHPRIGLARALASDPRTRPTAMMDLSDGLAMDLPRLTEHATVTLTDLPCREGHGVAAALGNGEDYELLFTAAPEADLPATLEGVRLTRVGTVTPSGGVRFLDEGGRAIDTTRLGWEHRGR